MKLIPIITEKSLQDAKEGYYTFRVDNSLTKYQIRKLISEVFGVNVKKVRTINQKGEKKRTNQGRIKIVKPSKKAIVTLSEKEKIDIFESKE
jgi:large subunit ribosomal protein L23